MKKIVAWIVAVILALGAVCTLTACGETTPNPKPDDKNPPTVVTVTGIEITTQPTKTKYVAGESFDATGMKVSKTMSDGTKTELAATDITYAPGGALKTSDKKVTVSYKESDTKTHTADVKITVTNDIKEVVVVTDPEKKSYITGEKFDPTGMTIKAVLEDGSEEDVVEVSADTVEYNTGKLVASDKHFEMVYGGFTFYYDMTVKCGAFMEAEEGLIIASGVKVGDAPNKVAIEADLNNAYCVNGEGTPSVRGIDKGLSKEGADGKTYNISEQRVDVRNYIFDPDDTDYTYEDFCATGGGNHSSFVSHTNILEFERTPGASVLYALTADKAGAVNLTLRMTLTDPDSSAHALERKLSDILEITVNGTKVNIADSVKLAEIDFSEKKAYVPSTTELSTLGDYKGTFTGNAIRTNYCWQNVTVPLNMVEGGNSIIIKSLINEKKDMRIDSLSFDGDASQVSLFNESAFAPEILSAKLKVEDDKVYMGLIVDPKSIGYDESAVKTVLGLTKVKSSGCCTWDNGKTPGAEDYDGNVNFNGSGDKNDPWTSPVSYGGLGYEDTSLYKKNGMGGSWGERINEREVTVEVITDGTYKDNYIVWLEVTIPNDTKLGTTPDKNRYIGAVYFSGFTYGSDYASVHPATDVLKTGDSTCVENGNYCYQVFCDTRDRYASFYAGNEINLILVVQNGTFDSTKVTDELPLRNKLMRRYVSHLADNDQELVDLHKPTEE